VGTPKHHAEIRTPLETFAKEITARALADAVDVVAAEAARFRVDEPTPTEELRRWRGALQAVAEGIEPIEHAVAGGFAASPDQEVDWPDIRTIELPRRGGPGRRDNGGSCTSPELEP